MGNIKSKFCTLIILTYIFSGFLLYTLSERCNAKRDHADVSILGEPTYKLTNTIVRNGRIIGKTFQIDIVLSNTGDFRSNELEVNLTDEEGFSLSQITNFEPGETKIISFVWSTINIRNQQLRVNFYPCDLDTEWNEYNSGFKIFTIKVAEDDDLPGTSAPGFEIILLITAIISINYLFKNRYQNF